MTLLSLLPVLTLVVALSSVTSSLAADQRKLSSRHLIQIQSQLEDRRNSVLVAEIDRTSPNRECARPPVAETRCTTGKLVYGLSALTLNRNEAEVREANAEIGRAVELIPVTSGYRGLVRPGDDPRVRAYDFHFVTASLLYRIVRSFGQHGRMPGRLSVTVEAKIKALFWDYVSNECKIADARASNIWRIKASENHWAMIVETCWAGAELLRRTEPYETMLYDDGSDAKKQYAAWTSYLIASTSARLRHGVFIEYFSTGYSAYSLGTFYTYYDFADDAPKLARLAKALLDVWWTMWAQEQINGVHGGSKTRVYSKHAPARDPVEGLPWLYLGMGRQTPANKRFSLVAMTLSSYRLPLVTMDIALDVFGRGTYETWSHHLGLQTVPRHGPWIQIDPSDAVLRYTYVTPTFVMGAAETAMLPWRRWSEISEQNRWNGLVLGGDQNARIYATTYHPGRQAYNDVLARQLGSTQVVGRLDPPYGKRPGPMRVWFGTTKNLVEKSGWAFVSDHAYVAVRPVFGGYKWDSDDPRWMILAQQRSPVIIYAAEASNFDSYADFQRKVMRQEIKISSEKIIVPTLDGRSVVLPRTPAASQIRFDNENAYKSPFLIWQPKAERFQIRKDGREYTINLQ
jgi:hypothetical protein